MSTVTIENAPKSFEEKFGNRIDFNEFVGLYWDGMDWCKYDEVIPSEEDMRAYKEQDRGTSSGKEFLTSLIHR